jgi:hypothetical protein
VAHIVVHNIPGPSALRKCLNTVGEWNALTIQRLVQPLRLSRPLDDKRFLLLTPTAGEYKSVLEKKTCKAL